MAPTSSSSSRVWSFFIKTTNGGKCKLCQREVKAGGNTTNLSNHIKRNHKDVEMGVICETRGISNSGPGVCASATSTHHEQERTIPTRSPGIIDFFPRNTSQITCSDDSDEILSSRASICSGNTISTSTSTSSRSTLPQRQQQIDTAFSSVKAYEEGGIKASKITSAIVYMIAKDNMPLNTTDKIGFRYFMKTVAPLYKVPGRKIVKNLIDEKYEMLSKLIQERISTVQHVTLTADVWTDTLNTKSYLGITVHCLINKILSSITIGIVPMDDRHSSEYISHLLTSTCSDWNISEEKVIAVVTDNGANIVKAVIDTYGRNKHLPCFAHTLNLVAQKSISDTDGFKTLIVKVKDIVAYFKHSVVAADELRKIQCTQTNSVCKKLIQEVSTRWNSMFYMLERFAEISEIVGMVLLKIPTAPNMLTSSELATVRELIKILHPLEMATKEISGEKYLTSSKVIPLVYCMTKGLEGVNATSALTINLKEKLMFEIVKRFKDVEKVHLLSIPTLLDPRFKKLHFSDPLACSKAISHINYILNTSIEPDVDALSVQDPVVTQEECGLWQFHEELVARVAPTLSATVSDGLHPALKLYLGESTIGLKEDPIQYWSTRQFICPQLSLLAEQYLSVVATSVPAERLFSKAGNIMTESRNRLDGKRLSKLLFLNSLDVDDWHIDS